MTTPNTNDTIELVKELRARTGVSLSVCRRLIEQTSGDIEAAIVALKKQGEIKAADKGGRIATQGKIHVYSHAGGQKVAVVEINCETDFAARSSDFQEFCELVGMQIVGMSPMYVRREDVPESDKEGQSLILLSQIPEKVKDAGAREKIFNGKLNKWLSEICLLEQECAAVPGKTIEQLRVELVAKLGENVNVRRFVRWEVGEGLELKRDNFTVEVEKLSGVAAGVSGSTNVSHHVARSLGDNVKDAKLECFCGAPSCQVCHS